MDYGILPVTGSRSTVNMVDNSDQQVMGKDDFLRMLVTQLNNQDPLNPMESQEFAAQLAQFSSLEQLSQINDNLDLSLQSDLLLSQSIANNMAVGLIGREVLALGNSLNGTESEISFQLSGEATAVTIEIRDTDNNLVRTLEGTDLAAGNQTLEWDQRDQQGVRVSEGEYTFTVTATDISGGLVEVIPLRQFHATGVVYENGNPFLLGGGDRVSFADIVQVTEVPGSTPPALPDILNPLREWDILD